jgi:hypothetical protein
MKNDKIYIYTVVYHLENYGHVHGKIEAKRTEIIDKLVKYRNVIRDRRDSKPEIEVVSMTSELKVEGRDYGTVWTGE